MIKVGKVLGVGFIHAFTLGSILVFGLMRDSIAETVTAPTDITFLSGMQYSLFLASGAFSWMLKKMYRMMWCGTQRMTGPNREDDEKYDRRKTQWAEIFVSFLGLFLWVFGYGFSLLFSSVTGNYNIYLWMWFSMGGVGAGLLYWNTLNMITTWVDDPTLALGWVFTAPGLYVSIFPYIENVIPATWVFHWYMVFALIAIVGGSVMLPLCFLLYSGEAKKKDRDSIKTGTKLYNASTFFVLCLGLSLFQMAFYIPYIDVPPHVTASTGLGASTADKSLVTSMIGFGSVTGRIVVTLFTYFFRSHMYVLTAFCLCMSAFFILGGLVANLAAMLSFVFLFGFFSGGCVTLIPMVVDMHWDLKKYSWDKEDPQEFKHMCYGTALFLGQVFAASMIGYVVNEYWHSMVFAGTAAGTATVAFMYVNYCGRLGEKRPKSSSESKVPLMNSEPRESTATNGPYSRDVESYASSYRY